MNAITRAVILVVVLQIATGVLLMTVYSPSTTTAWASVHYIQTRVPAGWFIRGLHHFASDFLIVLFVVHVAQRVVRAAYRDANARVWWATLAGAGLALALSLTGHLLPWDQEGYWGTHVRTNILARTPIVGPALAKLLVGGTEMGNLTLTRFYTLHVLILPAGLTWLTLRFLGVPTARPSPAPSPWKEEVPVGSCPSEREGEARTENLSARTLFPATVLLVIVLWAWVAHAIGASLLDAPADPASADYPARPEWHTRFLFQWLKAFEGPRAEVVGAIMIPGIVVAALLAFPFLRHVLSERSERRVVRFFAGLLAIGVIVLTGASYFADRNPSDAAVANAQLKQAQGEALGSSEQAVLRARQFKQQRVAAARMAARAFEIATQKGVPPEGPLRLLAEDAATAGPKLFAAHCAPCHRYNGHDGLSSVPQEPATSSDLAGFGTREWIRGLLENPMADRYFGRMRTPEGEPAHTRMSRFVEERLAGADDATRPALLADFDAAAEFLAAESGRTAPPVVLDRGREVFMAVCNECHTYDGRRTGTTHAPEMRGYGSGAWIELMIAEPDHETRYRSTGRERARMPSFKDRLSESQRRLIAEWLHGSVQ